jgi:hypothetical protein
MEPLRGDTLKQRLLEAVEQLVYVGDPTYMQGLSRSAFIEALAWELRFLGLYAHDDPETPLVIHALLEQHIDEWCPMYAEAWADDPWRIPEQTIHVIPSYFLQVISSACVGIPRTPQTHHYGFYPHLDRTQVQTSQRSSV